MRAFLTRVLAICGLLIPLVCSASPIYQFGFNVLSCVVHEINPYGPVGSACNQATVSELGKGRISLSGDAILKGSASYRYVQVDGPDDIFEVDGIVDMYLPQGSERVEEFFTPLCPTGPTCEVSVGVSLINGIASLSGGVSLRSNYDQLAMSGLDVWSGRLSSDFRSTGGDFSGYWTLVQVIPEPDALSLTAVALLTLVLLRNDKRKRLRFIA